MVFGVSKIQIALVLGGLGSLILSAGLGFGGMDFILRSRVREMMRLSPDSRLWKIWENIPVDIHFKVWIFNITNAENLNAGEKPILKEIGPYVYLVKKHKVDITRNDTEDTVEYRQIKIYHFVPEMSVGSDSDQVTYINVMFLSTAHAVFKATDIEAVHETLDSMLADKGEKLYVSSSVRDVLFDGVSIQAYVEMMEDPLVKMGNSAGLPEKYSDGKFAFYKGENGSDDGVWVVRTGITRSEDFNRVVSVNGKRNLDVWKGESCNALNGTDAQMYQPFIEPGVTKLQAFLPAMCRSITWNYIETVESEGIQSGRFHLADFLTPAENPEYSCFCPFDDQQQCISGLAYMDSCNGAPIIVSKPHFYNVHESVGQKVEGLSPNKEIHETKMDLNLFTGSSVKNHVRLQFSIELKNYPGMPSFRNVAGAIVPLLWMEMGATIHGPNKMMLSLTDTLNQVWPFIKYLWMLTSLSIIGLGGFLFMRKRSANAVTTIMDQKTVGELEKEFVFVFSKNALAMKQ